MMIGGRRQLPNRNALIVEEVGEEADQLGERERDERAGDANDDRHGGNDEHSWVGCKIPSACGGNSRHVLGNLVDVRRLLMLVAPAVSLLGTVDLMGWSLQTFFHRRIRIWHPYDDFVFLPLPAHRPTRCLIWRAW